jgi:hypothetical protein
LTGDTNAVAFDDVVRTHEEGEANEREPLLVLEPLMAFLDAQGIGSGEIDFEPVGEGHSNVTYLLRRDGAEAVVRRPPRGPARRASRACSPCATTRPSSAAPST